MIVLLEKVIFVSNVVTGLFFAGMLMAITHRFIECGGWPGFPPLQELNPYYGLKTKKDYVFITLLLLCIVIALTNCALAMVFSNTQIGAFYEKAEYDEDYEATLYIGDKPIFCIVHLAKRIEYLG